MLERTTLTNFQKIQLAAAAVAHQGELGSVSELAVRYGVSRNTVYDVLDKTQDILEQQMLQEDASTVLWVPVDQSQVARAITGLRVVGPNSLRDIEDLMPILYPVFKMSYGSIQAIAAQAEARAAQRNAQTDLAPITEGALDEMSSQGDPVLAGVDLDAGFLFLLALRDQRAAEDWADELDRCQQQGLDLGVVVKDAALGIEAGVRPYLYVHKGVTQGFLELFRFYYNHRLRRWGRHKGTSAHEAMTREAVADWLTWLGYPPSSQLLN